MEYFKEQGTSYMEAVTKAKSIYGESAKILNHRSIRYGGFLGMFSKEGVEVEGYINTEPVMAVKKNFDVEKKKLIAAAGVKRDDTLTKVLDMVKSIDEKIELGAGNTGTSEPESIEKIEELLIKNDFSYNLVKNTCARLRAELSLEQLEDYEFVQQKTLEWMGESIQVYKDSPARKGKIMILVGPTGVGKTTTIAKLAALNGLGIKGEAQKSVRMITIDNYRIGAKGQIQTYGDLMNIPVSCIESIDELRNKLMLYQEADLILIDTMGRSPRDYQNLAQMRELLDVCGKEAEIFLTVSSTTKAGDLNEIFEEFSSFGYDAAILTKLDETLKLGNVISVLSEHTTPVAYITDGQGVPQDIERAEVSSLLRRLEGFRSRESAIFQ
ncbi:MAG TPA: flagellar biosynthesis protein FlhF [Spirochaeta sp.]|nr:flagellar biosynthesis protein FlhF [Spirochaeta sp.]